VPLLRPEQFADLCFDVVPALPQLLLIFDVRPLLEPGIGNRPMPCLRPRTEAAVPEIIIEAGLHRLHKTGDSRDDGLLDPHALLLIRARRFDGNNACVTLAVCGDVACFDRLDERLDDRVSIVQIAQSGDGLNEQIQTSTICPRISTFFGHIEL